MESLETGQNFHHLDGDIINGSVTWSTVADVARPPACGVFCEATRARRRSNGGCGEAPARCVIAVVTARQPARGPDWVVFTLSDGVW